jgi:hypothetical protein
MLMLVAEITLCPHGPAVGPFHANGSRSLH